MNLYIANSPICLYCTICDLEIVMTVRDMERLLATFGISPSLLDQISRRLREDGRIPNAGRGATAPDIGPREVTLILLALAGSEVAARPRIALARLALLEIEADGPPRHARGFIPAVEALLSNAANAGSVAEIRVGRGDCASSIVYDDGHVERFVPADRPKPPVLHTEGVIWGGLIGELEIEMSSARNSCAPAPLEYASVEDAG
ncbi:hypothetical protein [Sphingomonas sp. CFBP 13728]|uniref:hypothetical protein n=1 Tax=Sphingomonas sp. CFBP 13728 TaxID=2775294 RepID=UPI001A7E778D|nr:hypothetical protein [Sphingomonas sp. CFBP 13728]